MRIDARFRSRTTELLVGLLYLFFFAIGAIGHYVEATRTVTLGLTPIVLLVFGASLFIPVLRRRQWGVVAWAAATYLFTFSLEAVGVATGSIFGSYTYEGTLGGELLDVPPIIGFNWVVVIWGSIIMAEGVERRLHVRSATAALLVRLLLVGAFAAGFDLLLEPVAVALDYWHWAAEHVPVRNYVAWATIAILMAVPYSALRLKVDTRLPVYYVLVQCLFVASLLPLAHSVTH